ncbi:hypothetical protein NPIL_526161 [Nephila pilipes]|uniref:Uncharacterized protein n=1 Tax=Nephila pilipes TaxID=299642 RepID=A0A8X6PVY7_NEPPI|nr:hypothetical protein NPIL_526161 [Nephila pilipes]
MSLGLTFESWFYVLSNDRDYYASDGKGLHDMQIKMLRYTFGSLSWYFAKIRNFEVRHCTCVTRRYFGQDSAIIGCAQSTKNMFVYQTKQKKREPFDYEGKTVYIQWSSCLIE